MAARLADAIFTGNEQSSCIASSRERFGLSQQHFVGLGAGRERLAPDDHHQRHRHRRDPLGFDVEHGRRGAVDEPDKTAELGHSPPRVVPRRAQQQMLRARSGAARRK